MVNAEPPVLLHEGDPSRPTYSFGGAEPPAKLLPGSVLDTSTLDCFAGRVRSARDLVSKVCDPRFLNPQTGSFFIEGAEPGDTLAVHFAPAAFRSDAD